jgi:hypothetical protein
LRELRRFLQRKAQFPQDVVLLICVAAGKKVIPGTFNPVHLENVGGDPYEVFKLYVSGIEFTLCVGKNIPIGLRLASATSQHEIITVALGAQDIARQLFTTHLKGGRPSDGMKNTLAEIAQMRSETSSSE